LKQRCIYLSVDITYNKGDLEMTTRDILLYANHAGQSRSCLIMAALLFLQSCGGGGGGGTGGTQPPGQEFYASPVRVSETLEFTTLAAGYHHTCAVTTSGDTYCWGSNEYDQLGSSALMESCSDGIFACSGTPVLVDGGHSFTQLAAGIRHTCALDTSGDAYCWGFGLGGQLGDGLRANSREPVAVAGGLKFTTIAATGASGATCGLTSVGDAWCWGINSSGSLGNGSATDGAHVPAPVATSLRFVSFSINQNNACAVSTTRDALCWGSNWYGQLGVGSAGGDGGIANSYVPVAVLGGIKFDQIGAGGSHSCALQSGGAVYCWGLGDTLGIAGADGYVSLPMLVVNPGGSPWVSIGIGYGQTCAMTADGELDCWGQVTSLVPNEEAETPLRIESDQTYTEFSGGGAHQCAIGADGLAYCWGINSWGQVGKPPSDP